jgi:hypothetical protein
VRIFSAVDASVWQAAEAATGCTSWSLGVRLLQSPRAAVLSPQTPVEQLQDLPLAEAQRHAVVSSPTARLSNSSSGSSSSNDVKVPQAQDKLKQQQGLRAKAAASSAAPVPRLQLQKLRNVDLGLVDSNAMLSRRTSSICKAAGSSPPSALAGPPSQQQQQQLKPAVAIAAGSSAGSTQLHVAPLPQWRSALTTRWQPGGRFTQQFHATTDKQPLQGSQTSRL